MRRDRRRPRRGPARARSGWRTSPRPRMSDRGLRGDDHQAGRRRREQGEQPLALGVAEEGAVAPERRAVSHAFRPHQQHRAAIERDRAVAARAVRPLVVGLPRREGGVGKGEQGDRACVVPPQVVVRGKGEPGDPGQRIDVLGVHQPGPVGQVAVAVLGPRAGVGVAVVAEVQEERRRGRGHRRERRAVERDVVRVEAGPEHEAERRRQPSGLERSRSGSAGCRSTATHGWRWAPMATWSSQYSYGPATSKLLPKETTRFTGPASPALGALPTSTSWSPSNIHSSTEPSARTPSCTWIQAPGATPRTCPRRVVVRPRAGSQTRCSALGDRATRCGRSRSGRPRRGGGPWPAASTRATAAGSADGRTARSMSRPMRPTPPCRPRARRRDRPRTPSAVGQGPLDRPVRLEVEPAGPQAAHRLDAHGDRVAPGWLAARHGGDPDDVDRLDQSRAAASEAEVIAPCCCRRPTAPVAFDRVHLAGHGVPADRGDMALEGQELGRTSQPRGREHGGTRGPPIPTGRGTHATAPNPSDPQNGVRNRRRSIPSPRFPNRLSCSRGCNRRSP